MSTDVLQGVDSALLPVSFLSGGTNSAKGKGGWRLNVVKPQLSRSRGIASLCRQPPHPLWLQPCRDANHRTDAPNLAAALSVSAQPESSEMDSFSRWEPVR